MKKKMQEENTNPLKRFFELYEAETDAGHCLIAALDVVDVVERGCKLLQIPSGIDVSYRYIDPHREEDRERAMCLPRIGELIRMTVNVGAGERSVTVDALCREDALIQAAELLEKKYSDIYTSAVRAAEI